MNNLVLEMASDDSLDGGAAIFSPLRFLEEQSRLM
jgi:hypothetical protein